VTVTVVRDSGYGLVDALTKARRHIKLAELGITVIYPRKAITGAMILEIEGDEGGRKAALLADRMMHVLRGDPVKISAPRKMVKMRVTRMAGSVTSDEVVAAVSNAGDCQIGEISVGELRRAPRGLTSVWLRCPLPAIKRICASASVAGDDGGGLKKIIVGWCEAKILPLPTRRLQYFKCLEPGHARRDCKSLADRSDRCYHCGEPGYGARECSSRVPRYPVCSDLGGPAMYRMGPLVCRLPPCRRKAIE
jgi:hypothetical protein